MTTLNTVKIVDDEGDETFISALFIDRSPDTSYGWVRVTFDSGDGRIVDPVRDFTPKLARKLKRAAKEIEEQE